MFKLSLPSPSFNELKCAPNRIRFIENIDLCAVDGCEQIDSVRVSVRDALGEYRFVQSSTRQQIDVIDRSVPLDVFTDRQKHIHQDYFSWQLFPIQDPPSVCFSGKASIVPPFSRWKAFVANQRYIIGIRGDYSCPARTFAVTTFAPFTRWAEFVGRRSYNDMAVVDSGVFFTPFGIAIGEMTFHLDDRRAVEQKIAFGKVDKDDRLKPIMDWEFYATFIGESQS
jgi:hypothetical protein